MAEYYPLISRAVAGLRTGTPEARRAIYDRAKQALVGQLRAMQPPVPEADIDRETIALDEAIARVEADVAPASKAADTTVPVKTAPVADKAPPLAAQPPPVRPERPSIGAVQKPGTAPVGGNAPTLGGVQRPNEPAARAALPPMRPSAFRLAKPTLKAEEPRPRAPEANAPVDPPEAVDTVAQPADLESAPLPVAPTLQVTAAETANAPVLDAAGVRPSKADVGSDGDSPTARSLDDGLRPAAPRPVDKRRPDLRVFIVAFAALAAVIAVAFTAWKLRDRPEELARTPVVAAQPDRTAGKIVERADDPGSTDSGQAVAPATQTTATAPAATAPAPSVPASDPAVATAAAPAAAASTDPALPVAYKAAILIDAPDDPQKVKTFVGTVVWRTETVNPGQDQPVGIAIRGDIDIPDAKVQLVFEMHKNNEPQFPASHTMELKFTTPADGALGGIKEINVPQMRREDMPTGDPLAGLPVTITDNYFLVGLTRGGQEDQNLELIRSRNWFDIPMLLTNGKPAKITFEKGAAGERIFNDVLQTWKGAAN